MENKVNWKNIYFDKFLVLDTEYYTIYEFWRSEPKSMIVVRAFSTGMSSYVRVNKIVADSQNVDAHTVYELAMCDELMHILLLIATN